MGTWDCNCGEGLNKRADWQKICHRCKKEKPALTKQQKEASPPIKRPDKEAPQITKKQRQKQPRKQRSKKILVKRGSTHVKTKDKQKKKSEKQGQKQPQQLPPNGSSSKPSMAKDEPKVTQPKNKEATGKQQNTHNLWTFSNVVLFTGSASYFDKMDLEKLSDSIIKRMKYMQDAYIQNGWNYKDFMTFIEYKLPKTFSLNRNWKFILNTTTPPFKEGTRTFKLYGSRKAYPDEGQDCGAFVCSSSWAGSKVARYQLPNGTPVANTSSYMLREDLRNWVESFDVGFPVFSVSDCNTFHTSGYVWSYYAIKKAVNLHPLKLAVINFDQHWDDGGHQDVIASDHWGNGVLRELHDLGFGGLYVVVGRGSEGGVGHTTTWNKKIPREVLFLSKDKKNKKDDKEKIVNWEKFWEQYEDINAVFITIDRDCLQNHYTQWGDDSYFSGWEKLQEVMSDALQPLFDKKRKTKAYLIGVDITGLPENYSIWDGKYIKKRGRPDSSSVWAAVGSEIEGLHAEVADQLEVTASLGLGI